MRCLRCGHCCLSYMVVIVVDPDIGPETEENLRAINLAEERCPHLVGDGPPYTCAVHELPWFKQTPCATHGQIERYDDELCRIGNYVLNGIKTPGMRSSCASAASSASKGRTSKQPSG